MAQVANGSALLVAWLITGVGIIFLALSLLHLTRQRPDLDGGIYNYAREGFGDLIGFCSAWGYWLCTTIGIVGYVVIAFSGVGMFTDSKDHVILVKAIRSTLWLDQAFCMAGALVSKPRY